MLQPIRIEDGIPIFLASDLDEYGAPDNYGFTRYMVISDNQTVMVADKLLGVEKRTRPIHHYCRTTRFCTVLSRLTQLRGRVEKSVVEEYMDLYGVMISWNKIRAFLKVTGRSYLYNMIPEFIHQINLLIPAYMANLGLPANLLPANLAVISFNMTPCIYNAIINDFKQVSLNFEIVITDRKYFPSIRFIAFKLLAARGALFNGVPMMRTLKKELALEEIWNKIKPFYFRVLLFFP